MKSKKILFTLFVFLFINSIAFCQQIGDGLAPVIPDFTIPLRSGVYNGLNAGGAMPDNSHPWQHLFVIRHPNVDNNHQLQISSSFASNDRLFFRKIAADLNPTNPAWHEIATRDGNTFNGNQIINGELKISSYSPLLVLQRDTNVGGFIQGIQTKNIDNTDNWFFGNLHANSWIVSKGDFNNAKFTVLDNGYVGIGTQNPIGKFDVRGNVFIGTTDLSIGTVGSFVQIDQGSSTGNSYSQIRAFSNGGNLNNHLVLQSTGGNVGIGSTNPDQKLTVKGKIHAEELVVDLAVPADYVFQKYYTGKSNLKSDYTMPTLAEIESFTKKNHHLPNVPSAQEIQQNGMSMGEMSNVLLQKVEELTLYAIEQNKELERLKTENNAQSKEIKTLKKENEMFIYLSKRLTEIENQLK